MKKIINGKSYNTETATLIGEYSTPGIGKSDFYYWEAGLYKTKKGNYFIAGEGHALSPFARCFAGSCGWGSDIDPKTPVKALEWAEKYLEPEEFEFEFRDLIEEA